MMINTCVNVHADYSGCGLSHDTKNDGALFRDLLFGGISSVDPGIGKIHELMGAYVEAKTNPSAYAPTDYNDPAVARLSIFNAAYFFIRLVKRQVKARVLTQSVSAAPPDPDVPN
jgi:hypothetical protein